MSEKMYIDGLGIEETHTNLVNNWWCYESQKEARRAFKGMGKYSDIEEEGGILVNDNPTGGGKTMTWLDPALRHKMDVIVLYPTNALISDQFSEIKDKYLKSDYYDVEDEVGVLQINAEVLSDYREKTNFSGNNGELISKMIRKEREKKDSVIVLTNPDIFVNIRNDVYKSSNISRVIEGFDTIVVDEFHHASLHGKCIMMNLMEQIRDSNKTRTNIAMLLSATPDRTMVRKLEEANAEVYNLADCDKTKPLEEIRQSDNCVIVEEDSDKVKDKENYRIILPKVEAEFRQGQTFKIGKKLVRNENLGETVDFIKGEDKTVIMLDSQKEVTIVKETLDEALPNYDVIQVDGKNRISDSQGNNKIDRFNNSNKAVMVSNSAVEVGINFETDRIIFSGTNPAKMLQRFGRLRNKASLSKAIIYCPLSMLDYAANMETSEQEPMTREKFRLDGIQKKMSVGRTPGSYPSMFGAHAAYRQALINAKRSPQKKQDEIMNKAKERIEKFFLKPYHMDYELDWEEFEQEHREMSDGVIKSLKQYRSGTPSLLVYDTNTQKIKTHEIQSILRTGKVEVVNKKEFIDQVGVQRREEVERKEDYTCGYVIYRGSYLRDCTWQDEDPTERSIVVEPTSEIMNLLGTPIADRKPKAIENFKIRVEQEDTDFEPIENWGKINKELQDFNPVVYPIEEGSYKARYKYGLDDFFFLTEIGIGSSASASLAIGHNALYLYCIIQEERFVFDENIKEDDIHVRVPDDIWSI